MNTRIFIFLLTLLLLQTASAQEVHRAYRNYATQEVHQRLLSENPGFSHRLKEVEKQHKQFETAQMSGPITIPVIFHIVYQPGQSTPDKSIVQAQLEMLNEDFNGKTKANKTYPLEKVQALTSRAAVPEISFCLASLNDEGDLIDPIRYVESSTDAWDIDDHIKSRAKGGDNPVNPSRFLNIWVSHLKNGQAGYAQMPGGPSSSDGIVIDSRFFLGGEDTLINKTYGEGKTLTHLVGSYLGLYELWNQFEPCKDDGVKDTPIHNAPNFITGEIYYHVSLCDSLLQPEMIMNFMDNTDDESLTMFTKGQVSRMRSVLSAEGERAGLTAGQSLCGLNEQTLEARGTNGIGKPALRLSPNPATQSINLQLSAPVSGWALCNAVNALGEVIWSDKYYIDNGTQTFQVDCSTWNEGQYMIYAIFDNGIQVVQKIMILIP